MRAYRNTPIITSSTLLILSTINSNPFAHSKVFLKFYVFVCVEPNIVVMFVTVFLWDMVYLSGFHGESCSYYALLYYI